MEKVVIYDIIYKGSVCQWYDGVGVDVGKDENDFTYPGFSCQSVCLYFGSLFNFCSLDELKWNIAISQPKPFKSL